VVVAMAGKAPLLCTAAHVALACTLAMAVYGSASSMLENDVGHICEEWFESGLRRCSRGCASCFNHLAAACMQGSVARATCPVSVHCITTSALGTLHTAAC
jgi:hypothetical protein